MAGHTPEPWELEGTTEFGFAIRGTTPGKPIADNIGTLANARLITQAPALLEALKVLLPDAEGYLRTHGATRTATQDIRDRIRQARTAIEAAS